jgi:hypothetical protein
MLATLCLGPFARAQEGEGGAASIHGAASDTAHEAASDTAPSPREQRDNYLWGTFGPPGLIGDALSSGFQQWRDVPREWGQSKTAYAKRFAAEYAESAIGDSTKYVIARLVNEDPSFRPCECTGLLPRLRHASLAPFRARKPGGRIVFSIATLGGLTAGGVVAASTGYQSPQGARGAVKYAAVNLAGNISADLLREFIIHRPRRGR